MTWKVPDQNIAVVKIRDDVPDVGLAGRYVQYLGKRNGRNSAAVKFGKEKQVRYFPPEFLEIRDRFVGQERDLDPYPYAGEAKGHHVYKGHGRYTYTEEDAENPSFGLF